LIFSKNFDIIYIEDEGGEKGTSSQGLKNQVKKIPNLIFQKKYGIIFIERGGRKNPPRIR